MAWMADQEREVKLAQELSWHDGWVAGFGFGGIGVRSSLFIIRGAVGGAIAGTVGVWLRGRPDTAFLPLQGWSDRWRCLVGRDQVVDDVLDEEALALEEGKYAVVGSTQMVQKLETTVKNAKQKRSGEKTESPNYS